MKMVVFVFSCAPSLLILKAFSWWKMSTRSLEWCKQPNLWNPDFLDYSYHRLQLPFALGNLHTHINVLSFCRWPPCNHMSSQCWRGDESSIIPYALYGIGRRCNFQQQFVKFSTRKTWCIFEYISKLWPRMKVFAFIKSVFTCSLSNEGAWRDLICQTLSLVPLFFIKIIDSSW